jgi:hypothetical protein
MPDADRMLNSFGVAVSQVMNKKKNPEPFSQVPTYFKWESNDGRSRLVKSIWEQLQLWDTRTGAVLPARFSSSGKGEFLLLAQSLMRKSMTFWASLCNWIDEFYGNSPPKQNPRSLEVIQAWECRRNTMQPLGLLRMRRGG